MGVGDATKACSQLLGFADVGNIASLSDSKMGVVRRENASFTDFFCPPPKVGKSILDGA